MKYYIATRLERHAEHNKLRNRMFEAAHELTYDWTHHGPVFRDGLARIREVAELELKGVKEAHLVIVLLPGGRGTHAELGMALSAGIPVLLHSEDAAFFRASPETCAFYHHPLCHGLHSAFDPHLIATTAEWWLERAP